MRTFLLTTLLLMISSLTIGLSAQGQTLAAGEKVVLGSNSSSEETAKAEARFLASIEAQTEQLTQLRDSLVQLLEVPEASTLATEEGVSREEMESMLDMYNRMLRTNEMILEGKARIIGVL